MQFDYAIIMVPKVEKYNLIYSKCAPLKNFTGKLCGLTTLPLKFHSLLTVEFGYFACIFSEYVLK